MLLLAHQILVLRQWVMIPCQMNDGILEGTDDDDIYFFKNCVVEHGEEEESIRKQGPDDEGVIQLDDFANVDDCNCDIEYMI